MDFARGSGPGCFSFFVMGQCAPVGVRAPARLFSGDPRAMRPPPTPPTPPNAFDAVRSRGADAVPRKASAHRPAAPAGAVLLFNRRGLRTVGLAPRMAGSICIESRAQSQASLDKSRRIARDWRQ